MDIATLAKDAAGNWRKFRCFAWHRASDLEDADNWMIYYTSNRDSSLREQSNEAEIDKRLKRFTYGAHPSVVAERHNHWAVGYVDGYSIRVFDKRGRITKAFEEVYRIREVLADQLLLNEEEYSEREYNATLENYRSELYSLKGQLPDGWEAEVYSWFHDNGLELCTENRDDQGGYADKEQLLEALEDLGLLPDSVDAG